MKHFTMNEFRCRCGCLMTAEVSSNIERLVGNVLDPLRERYGKPIYVTSGYRCTKRNKAVGGVPNSQHLRGEAADITAGNRKDNKKLARLVMENGNFDQLILENRDRNGCPQWLHVSWSERNRKEVLLK